MCGFHDEQLDNFMKQAILEAIRGWKKGEVPVGAVVVSSSGQILSSAHNCPISMDDPTAHAEILAIRKAGVKVGNYRLNNAWLFVTLEPCVMCAGAMVWARLKGVVFGVRDPKSGAFGSVLDINQLPGLNHRMDVKEGVLASECSQLLGDFFRKRRKDN